MLNSADYGPLVITKPVTITAEGAVAGILATSDPAIAVNVGPTGIVNLRGLEVDGSNTASVGVQFISGQSLSIQKSVFRGFTTAAIWIAPAATTTSFLVSDTLLANNRGSAILVGSPQASVRGTLNRVATSGNGYGIVASGSKTSLTVTDSIASSNSYGIVSVAAATLVRDSSISNNTVGLFATQNGIIRVGQSILTANTNGVAYLDGGQIQSFGNNAIAGNANDGSISSVIPLK